MWCAFPAWRRAKEMGLRSFGRIVSVRGRAAGGGEDVRSVCNQEKRKFEFRGVSEWPFQEMELRRALAIRGWKWVSKAWLLLCVMVCALFGFWVLIGSSYYSSDYSYFWMSRDGRQNEAALQNLDEISLALLKLGLPLSAYALSMQSAQAHDDSWSSDGSLDHVNHSTGFGIVDQPGDGETHSVMTERGNVNVHGSELMTDTWKANFSGSELSIYSIASTYNYAQQLWVFQNVCYNGSHLIRLESESCREPEDAVPGGLLTPIVCGNGGLYARRLAMVGKDTGIPMAEQTASWMTSRHSTVWRNETVAVMNLGRHTTDPARFLQKVNMLLLLNNASTVAFVDRVETFMFRSHHRVAKILNHHVDGEEMFHRAYLSTVLSRAVPMDEEDVDGIFHGGGKTADSRVQLNVPFSAATQESPLCFRKVVLTGTLKGSCWPGGVVVADVVRQHLSERFHTKSMPRASGKWPCLVSLLGNNTRRTLSSTSKEGFQALLNKKTMGLEVLVGDFNTMDFRQQFDVLQRADIVTGFYGPDLIVPAVFCRKMAILVEIIPFKVQDRAHEIQAMDSGLIYVAHQCEEGNPQDADSIFQNQSSSACMTNSKCKQHYATVRKIQLTKSDLSRLKKVISLARLITSEMIVQNPARRRNMLDASSFLVENLIGGGGKCKSFVPTDVPSVSCGNNWISFTSESRGPVTCCY